MTDPTRPSTGPDPTVELRRATTAELRLFLSPVLRAFAEEFNDAEFEAEAHTFEADRTVGAFEGGDVVGCAGAYSFRLAVPGGDVPAAGVTLVAVSPSHRRRGILRRLMRQQLDEVHERGEPVAILWASEGAIYGRFGYGLATLAGTFDIERTRASFARPIAPAGRVRFMDPEEAIEPFSSLYERVRSAIPGEISRSEAFWRWIILRDQDDRRRSSGGKCLVGYEVDGTLEGYAIYRAKNDWDERGPKNDLLVLEVRAATPRAERDLWRWLLDIDLVARIRGVRQPVPHPLFHLLAEPRRMGLTVGDGLWLRLVDLPAALGARSYATPGSLVLDVGDEVCPWNAGRWRLDVGDEVAPGGGNRARIGRADVEPDLALDVADLGAAYLGGVRLEELRRAGRLDELRPGAVRAADVLFATARAPWCSTMF